MLCVMWQGEQAVSVEGDGGGGTKMFESGDERTEGGKKDGRQARGKTE